jgi:hypothetical protein
MFKKAIRIRENVIVDHLIFVDPDVDDDVLEEVCDDIDKKTCFDDVAYMFERRLGEHFLGLQREYFEDYDSVEYYDEFDMDDEEGIE